MSIELISNENSHEAHAQLIVQLCDAMSAFVKATSATHQNAQPPEPKFANDNVETAAPERVREGDEIGLSGIAREYGLRISQVSKLRQYWGFPAPVLCGRRLVFSRSEVEDWARKQPTRDNLAIVLRCRAHCWRRKRQKLS